MATYKITIPEPCHEKWADMSATERGAFCHNCKKDVIDFTGITTVELNDYLNKNKTLSCGRFTRQQLDAVYIINNDKHTRKWFYKSWVAAIASFLMGVLQPKAEAKNTVPQTEWMDKSTEGNLVPVVIDEPVDTNEIVITGKVVNEKGEGLPFVAITFDENVKIGVVTDIDGNFKIKVPDDLKNKKLSLTFKSLGFAPLQIDFGVVHQSKLSIEVVLKEQILGSFMGIVIMGPEHGPKAQADRFYFGME